MTAVYFGTDEIAEGENERREEESVEVHVVDCRWVWNERLDCLMGSGLLFRFLFYCSSAMCGCSAS